MFYVFTADRDEYEYNPDYLSVPYGTYSTEADADKEVQFLLDRLPDVHAWALNKEDGERLLVEVLASRCA